MGTNVRHTADTTTPTRDHLSWSGGAPDLDGWAIQVCDGPGLFEPDVPECDGPQVVDTPELAIPTFKVYRNAPVLAALCGSSVALVLLVCLLNATLGESIGVHSYPMRDKDQESLHFGQLAEGLAREFNARGMAFRQGLNDAQVPETTVAEVARTTQMTDTCMRLTSGHSVTKAWLAASMRDETQYATSEKFVALTAEVEDKVTELAGLAIASLAESAEESSTTNSHLYMHQVSFYSLTELKRQVLNAIQQSSAERTSKGMQRVMLQIRIGLAAARTAAARGPLQALEGVFGPFAVGLQAEYMSTLPTFKDPVVLEQAIMDRYSDYSAALRSYSLEGMASHDRRLQKAFAKWIGSAFIVLVYGLFSGLVLWEFHKRVVYEQQLRVDFARASDTSQIIANYCEMLENWQFAPRQTAASCRVGSRSGGESMGGSANSSAARVASWNGHRKQDCHMEMYLKQAVVVVRHLRPFVPAWVFKSDEEDAERCDKLGVSGSTARSVASSPKGTPASAGRRELLNGSLSGSGRSRRSMMSSFRSSRGSMRSGSMRSGSMRSGSMRSAPTTNVSHDQLKPDIGVGRMNLNIGMRRDTRDMSLLLMSTRHIFDLCSGHLGTADKQDAANKGHQASLGEGDYRLGEFFRLVSFLVEHRHDGLLVDVSPLYITAQFKSEVKACRCALDIQDECATAPPIAGAGSVGGGGGLRFSDADALVTSEEEAKTLLHGTGLPVVPTMGIVKGKVPCGIVSTGMKKSFFYGGETYKTLVKVERMNSILGTTILCSLQVHQGLNAMASRIVKTTPCGVLAKRGLSAVQVICEVAARKLDDAARDPNERIDRLNLLGQVKKGRADDALTCLRSYILKHEYPKAEESESPPISPSAVSPKSTMTKHLFGLLRRKESEGQEAMP